jgi:hypothetical protein
LANAIHTIAKVASTTIASIPTDQLRKITAGPAGPSSFIGGCKLNEVEPWGYLRDVLPKIAARTPTESREDLLPDRWLAAHPSHRWAIASLRQPERAT